VENKIVVEEKNNIKQQDITIKKAIKIEERENSLVPEIISQDNEIKQEIIKYNGFNLDIY
jgi:hypothetical protein